MIEQIIQVRYSLNLNIFISWFYIIYDVLLTFSGHISIKSKINVKHHTHHEKYTKVNFNKLKLQNFLSRIKFNFGYIISDYIFSTNFWMNFISLYNFLLFKIVFIYSSLYFYIFFMLENIDLNIIGEEYTKKNIFKIQIIISVNFRKKKISQWILWWFFRKIQCNFQLYEKQFLNWSNIFLS